MADSLTNRLHASARSRTYRLTQHAEREREADAIFVSEIEEALASDSLEVLELYPEDQRGASALVLGFTAQGAPLHLVAAYSGPEVVVIVTLDRPDPSLWDNWRRRLVK